MKLNNKKYIMFIQQGNDFLKYKLNDNNNYHKYINNKVLHTYFRLKNFFNFYNTIKFLSLSIKKDDMETPKVFEYNVNGQNVLF